MNPDPVLLRRYRVSLAVFITGLVASGLTAFPLLTEMRSLATWLGITDPAEFENYAGLRHWIAFVLFGMEETYSRFPFFGYGTDWLAFGHLASAALFAGAFVQPISRAWVLRYGLFVCGGVIPLAFIAGAAREIPVYWRLIDCSFGIFGAMPLLYCLHLVKRMRNPG